MLEYISTYMNAPDMVGVDRVLFRDADWIIYWGWHGKAGLEVKLGLIEIHTGNNYRYPVLCSIDNSVPSAWCCTVDHWTQSKWRRLDSFPPYIQEKLTYYDKIKRLLR